MSQWLAIKENLINVEEYLAFEEKSKLRHEYMDGEVFLMAGGKRRHSLIASNIGGELYGQLKERKCEIHYGDLRIKARATHYVYSDVVITCGEMQIESYKQMETLLNPQIIFEVLSKSTEARDRGEKAKDYRSLKSLTDYLLISQEEMFVEHYIRQNEGGWKLIEYKEADEEISLSSIECKIALRDVYRQVEFPKLKLIASKTNGKQRG